MQQVAPIWEDGKNEHSFDGPFMTRWIVPQDDKTTMLIEFRHISESEEATPAWWLDPEQMLPAQLPISENKEDQQRQPGDYEAQTSQREIAIHGLEHLGATDQGVILFQRQVRKGIQAVREGKDPEGLSPGADKVMPTFANDTVVNAPPAPTPELERQLLLDTGRRLAEEYIENPPNLKATERQIPRPPARRPPV